MLRIRLPCPERLPGHFPPRLKFRSRRADYPPDPRRRRRSYRRRHPRPALLQTQRFLPHPEIDSRRATGDRDRQKANGTEERVVFMVRLTGTVREITLLAPLDAARLASGPWFTR